MLGREQKQARLRRPSQHLTGGGAVTEQEEVRLPIAIHITKGRVPQLGILSTRFLKSRAAEEVKEGLFSFAVVH